MRTKPGRRGRSRGHCGDPIYEPGLASTRGRGTAHWRLVMLACGRVAAPAAASSAHYVRAPAEPRTSAKKKLCRQVGGRRRSLSAPPPPPPEAELAQPWPTPATQAHIPHGGDGAGLWCVPAAGQSSHSPPGAETCFSQPYLPSLSKSHDPSREHKAPLVP